MLRHLILPASLVLIPAFVTFANDALTWSKLTPATLPTDSDSDIASDSSFTVVQLCYIQGSLSLASPSFLGVSDYIFCFDITRSAVRHSWEKLLFVLFILLVSEPSYLLLCTSIGLVAD